MSGRFAPRRPADPRRIWRQAGGLFRRWRYEARIEEGRRAWAAGQAPDAAALAEAARTSVLWRFMATAEPWRLRMDVVERSGSDDDGRQEIRKEGSRWWARWADESRSGDDSAGDSVGTDGLELMLCPPDLVGLLGLRPVSMQVRDGREVVEYVGVLPDRETELARFEEASFAIGEWIVLGSDSIRVAVDTRTTVVVGWQASIGGKPAGGGELSDLDIH
ncbi:hypothetical protein ACGF07_34885 [Kitasatospora sp. NPDC048194]